MLSDLKRYLRVDEIFELGQGALPDGLLDIRGQIENEPPRVIGYIDHRAFVDLPMYFGITDDSDSHRD